MICNTIGLTADSFESIYVTGGAEVAEVYGGLNYADPIFYKTQTMTGTAPLVFDAYPGSLKSYTISGNTVQNGTPTPEAPVDVVGCGEWDATEQSYKLPITCANVTSNIYLGNVQTTRRIKKLVLTGGETFGYANSCFTYTFDNKPISVQPTKTVIISNAYKGIEPRYRDQLRNYECCITRNYNQIAIRDDNYTDVADFKSYLAAQYANGNPVTVWYVLAEPKTAVVNEPIHKIGDYADTITMAQAEEAIPTIAGSNTLSVGTTVQPSSVSIAGHIKPTTP